MQQDHFTLHNALVRWELSPFPLAVLAVVILLAVWYLRADWALALRGRRWPGSRTAAFLGGLFAIDVAFQ
jgi:cytochrome c oxidase assembly factor CtaG